jgi:hypothetical protein
MVWLVPFFNSWVTLVKSTPQNFKKYQKFSWIATRYSVFLLKFLRPLLVFNWLVACCLNAFLPLTLEIPGSIPGRRTLCAIIHTDNIWPGAEGFEKGFNLNSVHFAPSCRVVLETAFNSNHFLLEFSSPIRCCKF